MKNKKFDSLTNKEILELENKEINYYISLKKIENGILLVKYEFEEEPLIEVPEPTKQLYKLDLFYNVRFLKLETAKLILDLIKKDEILITNDIITNDHKYIEYIKNDKSDIGMSLINVYKNIDEAEKVKTIYNENYIKTNKKNEINNEYNKQKQIEEKIWKKINKVYSKCNEAKKHLDIFKNEYLPLESDIYKALSFYEMAYNISDDIKEYLLTEDINILDTIVNKEE